MNIEELIEDWENKGLLIVFPEEKKLEAAIILEDMKQYCLTLPSINENVSTFIFPIMVRIMRHKNIFLFDNEKLLKDIELKWIQFKNDFEEELKNRGIDTIAEFCATYSKEYYPDKINGEVKIEKNVLSSPSINPYDTIKYQFLNRKTYKNHYAL